MLVVVVISYRHTYDRSVACALEKIHRDAAAEARHFHNRLANRPLDHLNHCSRCWQVHWSARGRITRAPVELDDSRMAKPDRRIRRLPDYEETLLSNMVVDQPPNALEGLIRHKPEVDGRRGLAADYIGRLSADMPSLNSPHVQGRLQDLLGEGRSASFCPCQPQFLLQVLINVRHLRQGSPFLSSEWPYIVVEPRNQDPAVGVAHGVEQMGEQNDRIRGPVPIMPAVKPAIGTIDRHFQVGRSASTKEDLHPMALVDRAITKNPYICVQPVRILIQQCLQVRRSSLLFPLQEESQVYRQRDVSGSKRVQCCHETDYRRFVIARGTRIDTGFRIERRGRGSRIDPGF